MEVLSLLAGFLLGILFGIVPGLHPNLAFSIMVAYGISARDPLSFLAGFLPANAMFDALPSVLVGAPEGGKGISAFESKMLFSRGMGYYGVLKTAWASFLGFSLSGLLFIPAMHAIPWAYRAVSGWIPFIILAVATINIAPELPDSLVLFALSGMLGFAVLNSAHSSQLILGPLLTGLFGMPQMLLSFGSKHVKQTKQFPLEDNFRGIKRAAMLGIFSSLLPALGASQLMFLAAPSTSDFISFSSSLAASSTMFSILTLEETGKARTGAAAFLSGYAFAPGDAIRFFMLSIMASAASMLIITSVAWEAAKIAGRASAVLNLASIFAIVLISALTTGMHGILVLTASSALGVYAALGSTRKTHLLGCLIYPTIIIYISRLI